jgi:hypothetical protein
MRNVNNKEVNMPNDSNITVIVGHFGSGKTEIAINSGIYLAKYAKETILVDLDIVNPFFRSTEVKDILNDNNVHLISPNFASTHLDIPSLPPSIQSVFNKKDASILFDVGGNEDGATALGRYYPYFKNSHYEMYFVINTCRPFTKEINDIIELFEKIEQHSRLKITHLISNSNLSFETTADIVIQGYHITQAVSKKLNIPIKYITATEDIISQLPDEYKKLAFPLKIFMKPSWL